MSELTDLAAELVVLRRKVKDYQDLLRRIVEMWDKHELGYEKLGDYLGVLISEARESIPEEK